MQITTLTIFWSVFALTGVLGLYFFNHGLSILTFLTSRKYLLLIIIGSLFGMREQYWVAIILVSVAITLMIIDYKPYLKRCEATKILNNAHDHK